MAVGVDCDLDGAVAHLLLHVDRAEGTDDLRTVDVPAKELSTCYFSGVYLRIVAVSGGKVERGRRLVLAEEAKSMPRQRLGLASLCQ